MNPSSFHWGLNQKLILLITCDSPLQHRISDSKGWTCSRYWAPTKSQSVNPHCQQKGIKWSRMLNFPLKKPFGRKTSLSFYLPQTFTRSLSTQHLEANWLRLCQNALRGREDLVTNKLKQTNPFSNMYWDVDEWLVKVDHFWRLNLCSLE